MCRSSFVVQRYFKEETFGFNSSVGSNAHWTNGKSQILIGNVRLIIVPFSPSFHGVFGSKVHDYESF